MSLTCEELLMKLGTARNQFRKGWRLVVVEVAATMRRSPTGSTASSCAKRAVAARYTEPEPELLLNKLKLDLPAQPPPKITLPAPISPTSLWCRLRCSTHPTRNAVTQCPSPQPSPRSRREGA
jgi:hypothetical protein